MSGEKKNNPVSPASAVGVKKESEKTNPECSLEVVRDPLTDRQSGPTAAGTEHRPDSTVASNEPEETSCDYWEGFLNLLEVGEQERKDLKLSTSKDMPPSEPAGGLERSSTGEMDTLLAAEPSISQIPTNIPIISVSDQTAVGGVELVSDESKGARSKSSTAIRIIKNFISPKKNTEKGPTDIEDTLKTVDAFTCKGNRSGKHDGNCPINCQRLSPNYISLKVPQSKKEKSPQNKLKYTVSRVLSPKKLSGFFSRKKSPGKEMDTAEAMFQGKDSSDGKPGKKIAIVTPDSASRQGKDQNLENPDESRVGSVITFNCSSESSESDTEIFSDEY